MKRSSLIPVRPILALIVAVSVGGETFAQEAATAAPGLPWWTWPLLLFVVSFLIGLVAVLGGVGGGVMFVPIVSGFFPFHLDFVRGTGLMLALCSSLAAGPSLLKRNIASLRLAMPVALIASVCSAAGALVGLALPTQVVQISLGVCIIGICVLMVAAKRSEHPNVPASDALSQTLGIYGVYHEQSTCCEVDWKIHRTPLGLTLFVLIGFMGGMFGMGAGWANVPVLNLVMGAPLKVSVASSSFLLSITGTAGTWIYLHRGCVIPMLVVPSAVGIMLGSFVSARILAKAKVAFVRWVVIGILLLAGIKSLLKGLGIG
jgi:uncharacterized membrane protein YfcA